MPATLIRGATVVTMDKQGDLPRADILVQDDRIVDIAPSIAAPDAEVVDASGCIVIPGLVNAHMHTWQTALRGVAANWTLLEYFKKMHAGLATAFQPQDLFIATRMGALNQLNCGTTTLADWCHNNPTPSHNDAAIEGLLSTGIRAAFFHGTPKPDPKPGQVPFWEVPHPRAEVERLAEGGTRATRCCPSTRRCSARTTRRSTSRCTTSAWRATWASSPRCTRAAARRARPTAGTSWRRPACSAPTSTSSTATRWTTCNSSASATWA
jgi:cytosine/adenosine deaminase-related metal-dependent hydrolase